MNEALVPEAAADALAEASFGALRACWEAVTSPREPTSRAAHKHPVAWSSGRQEQTDGDVMQERWRRYSKRPLQRMLALQAGVIRVGITVLHARLTKNEQKASELRRAAGKRAVRKLLQLGPTYVKLGQIASCRGDLLPIEYIEELKKLQDQVPAFSAARAKKTLEEEFGKPLHELLRSFDEKPLAAASLGQVHAAVTTEGQKVAIKVQREGLKEMYDLDLADLAKVMKLLDRFDVGVAGASQNWTQLFQDACVLLYREIDYTAEAENSERCRKNLEERERLKWIKVPAVVSELTSPRVLTMEFAPGIKISDIEALDKAAGVDRKVVANRLAYAYLLMFCKYGFFNTDPHPGNLAVDDACPGGRIIMYDFGQAAELEGGQRKGILDTIQAIVDLDAAACTKAFVTLGCLGSNADLKAIEDDIAKSFRMGKMRSRASNNNDDSSNINTKSNHNNNNHNNDENKASKGPKPVTLTGEKQKNSASAKGFQLPSSLAFAARALTQLQGVGVLLNEDWEFIAEVAPKVPAVQMEQGAGLRYLTRQVFKVGARQLESCTDNAYVLCVAPFSQCWQGIVSGCSFAAKLGGDGLLGILAEESGLLGILPGA